MTRQRFRRAACKDCSGTYELVPPPDSKYSVPKEEPTTKDFKIRTYLCDTKDKHPNVIYWQRFSIQDLVDTY